jgi:hypothetical protein
MDQMLQDVFPVNLHGLRSEGGTSRKLDRDAIFGDFGAFGGDYLFCRFLCVLCGLARLNLFCCFLQGQRCEYEASRALDQVAIFDREDIPSFSLFKGATPKSECPLHERDDRRWPGLSAYVGPMVDGIIGVKCPPNFHSVCANMVLNINGMKFEKAGRYSIDLAMDNRHEKSLPLTVMQAEPKAQQQG